MAAPTPYQSPLPLSTLQNLALTSKSYRVFGLTEGAWQNTTTCRNNNDRTENNDDMMEICQAIYTALSDDAGGFITAGFHLEKVGAVQISSTNTAMFTCALYPNDAKQSAKNSDRHVALNPQMITKRYRDANKSLGNDEYYASLMENYYSYQNDDDDESGDEGGRFKLRIVVSKANDCVATKQYYDGLFDFSKELFDKSSNGGGIMTQQMVDESETLQRLKQHVLDVRIANQGTATSSGNNDGAYYDSTKGNKKLHWKDQSSYSGYEVTIMLCEPHIQTDDVVIPPPSYLDKCHDDYEPVPFPTDDDDLIYDGGTVKHGVFSTNVCASLQFVKPGPWEKANLDAFELISFDVRKALVRVEFPRFPEGCRKRSFKEVYQLNARLQSGSYATVCRGTHRASGKKVAIKCVLRQGLPPHDDAAIYDEVLILSTLKHPQICSLIDFFEEVECYFLVMELMSGGDLFERIGKRKTYTENDARNLCRKMLESVRYCHENSVAHCDMKPKNLLLVNNLDDVDVKLSDFGFATRVYEPRSITKQCGTPFFISPEILMRSPYDQQSDMWSVGVIIYLLLGGDLPFMGRTQKELFRSIVLCKYDFPEESWSHVSEEAKDLVRKLLVTDPSKRLTSQAAMQSPWMRRGEKLLMMNNLQYTSRRLLTFNARMKLRSSMFAVSVVTSMNMRFSKKFSERSLDSGSQRNVESGQKKLPSFLDLPEEKDSTYQK